MPETRQSVERKLSKKRRLLAILEEQIAGYTELEAPVSKLAERDQLQGEVARLEALLVSGELPDADDAEISVWEGLGARIEPEEVPLAHPSSPKALLEKTGRTLMAVQFKIRRPAPSRKLLKMALGVLIVLVLSAAGFWIYTRLSAEPTPIPWPTPRVEATQTPVLGFGNLWNGDPGVQGHLGIGVNEEQSILYLEQRFSDDGIMLQLIEPPSPFIYVLYDDGQWEVYEGKLAVKSQGTPTGEVAAAASFRPIYEGRKSIRERLGSPQSHPQEIQGTIQSFEHGQMIWTGADDRHIYTLFVVDGQPDKWTLYPDTWVARGDVVFASDGTGHWQIHTMTSDGGEVVPLTVEPADAENFEPVWVPPERKSIAFVSTTSGLPKIWLIDRNGSNRRQLTTGSGTDGHPSVAWDGELLAFHSDRDGVFQIYLIDLDGTNVRRLTNDSFDNRNPDWAPDGQSLAFDSEREGRRGIYSVDVGTGKVEPFLNPESGETYQQPAWSPDGKQLAFVFRVAGQHVICVADADGSGLTKIEGTTGFDNVDAPVWSSDGQRLAFTAYEGGKASIVMVSVSDGSILAKISGRGDYKDPDW
jgi:hypothetical protein